MKKCWYIPPKHNAAFVAATADALEVYSRPYDEAHPIVCRDEKVVPVMDNLNTHSIASLYATFPPQRARQFAGNPLHTKTLKHLYPIIAF